MNSIIGIDPGANGAISTFRGDAYYSDDIDDIISYKCPDSVEGMSDIVGKCLDGSRGYKNDIHAYIEQVHAMPHDGRSSLFKFGTNYGKWLGVLGAYAIDTTYVSPQKWMKWWEVRMSTKLPKIKKDRKNMLKSWASECTSQKVTLYNADAILIAMYGYFQVLESEIIKLENDKNKLLSEKEKLNV